MRAVAGCSDRYMPKTPRSAHSFPNISGAVSTMRFVSFPT